VRARIHRGAHEIGGSCIEVEAAGKRLLLDLGWPLDLPLDADLPLPDVAGLTGADTTMRYVHVLDRDLRDGSDALANLYRSGGSAVGPTVPVAAGSGSVVGPREIGAHEDDHDLVH
jgi:hypothetical protein